jgi:myo-inositol-1(or 4)-monophosphatase
MSDPFEVLLDTAHRMANAAGKAILPHFRNLPAADSKSASGYDPVTAADREAEEVMRAIVAELFPDHGVIGEEFVAHNPGADRIWIVDPIDGTRSFIMGLPLWGTLVGFSEQGRPIIGLLDQPYIGERFWNDRNAAWFRGPAGLVRCTTRKCQRLGDAILAATTPDMFSADETARFEALTAAVKMRRFGGDCYAYGMLALGQIDLVVEASLKTYDIAPLIPIIEKAGGVVTDWTGGDASQGGKVVACGDRQLHAQVLAMLNA